MLKCLALSNFVLQLLPHPHPQHMEVCWTRQKTQTQTRCGSGSCVSPKKHWRHSLLQLPQAQHRPRKQQQEGL